MRPRRGAIPRGARFADRATNQVCRVALVARLQVPDHKGLVVAGVGGKPGRIAVIEPGRIANDLYIKVAFWNSLT